MQHFILKISVCWQARPSVAGGGIMKQLASPSFHSTPHLPRVSKDSSVLSDDAGLQSRSSAWENAAAPSRTFFPTPA